MKRDRRSDLYAVCGLLVAGLWTKAFFIPILAATVLTLAGFRKSRAAFTVLAISMLGLPWYVSAFLQTGSLTGLPETVSAQTSVASSLSVVGKIDWSNAFSVLLSSHIWIGNASLLGVRRWMYQVIFGLFLMGLAGILVQQRRVPSGTLTPLLLNYAVFGGALIYYATQVFQATGTSVVQGWYPPTNNFAHGE